MSFPFQIEAEGFADGAGIADDVEDVIPGSGTRCPGTGRRARAGSSRTSLAPANLAPNRQQVAEAGGFAADDLEIGFLEIEVVAVMDHRSSPSQTWLVVRPMMRRQIGSRGWSRGGSCGRSIVAQKNGGFVAADD